MTSGALGALLPARPATEAAFVWFLRIIAIYCLCLGVGYWVRLIGVYPGSLWRFDRMPVAWQIASTSLAAFFPFAAIGLWMTASWGPAIWFICAATEGLMYAGFPQIFGHRDILVISHGLTALAYVAFRGAIFLEKRRAAREDYEER